MSGRRPRAETERAPPEACSAPLQVSKPIARVLDEQIRPLDGPDLRPWVHRGYRAYTWHRRRSTAQNGRSRLPSAKLRMSCSEPPASCMIRPCFRATGTWDWRVACYRTVPQFAGDEFYAEYRLGGREDSPAISGAGGTPSFCPRVPARSLRQSSTIGGCARAPPRFSRDPCSLFSQ
jgi:hypothetical protein